MSCVVVGGVSPLCGKIHINHMADLLHLKKDTLAYLTFLLFVKPLYVYTTVSKSACIKEVMGLIAGFKTQ